MIETFVLATSTTMILCSYTLYKSIINQELKKASQFSGDLELLVRGKVIPNSWLYSYFEEKYNPLQCRPRVYYLSSSKQLQKEYDIAYLQLIAILHPDCYPLRDVHVSPGDVN